jgi:hypothetical protein
LTLDQRIYAGIPTTAAFLNVDKQLGKCVSLVV